MIDTPDKSEGDASATSTFDVRKIWRVFAPKLLSFINITAFLTVVGFFVVQSYLASVTRIFTFNVSVTQYVAAGISLVIITFIVLIPIAVASVILGIVLAFSTIGIHFVTSLIDPRYRFWDSFLEWVSGLYNRFYNKIWTLHEIFTVVAFSLFIISIGLEYGRSLYWQIPRMLGGGMPAEVILIFKEDQSLQTSSWGFPINSSNPRQSEQVQLIIELTDSIIVRHLATNTVTTVKNDVLQGIIDAQPPISNLNTIVTPTPIQLLSTPTP